MVAVSAPHSRPVNSIVSNQSRQAAGAHAWVAKTSSASRDAADRRPGGSAPDNPQAKDKLSDSRFTRLPSSPGIGPVNAFPPRYRDRSWTRFPNHDGTGPVKSFQ